MTNSSKPYEGVVVVAPASTQYAKKFVHNTHWYIGTLLSKLIQTAGISKAMYGLHHPT